MALLWDGGTKAFFVWAWRPSWSFDQDHLNKLKTFDFFPGNDWMILLKLGIQHRALEYCQVCSNNDLRLTFDFFMQRSILVPYTFEWETAQLVDYSETV